MITFDYLMPLPFHNHTSTISYSTALLLVIKGLHGSVTAELTLQTAKKTCNCHYK